MTERTTANARPETAPGPFVFDIDRLHTLASDGVIRAGIAYLKDKRVLSLAADETRLVARVEGWRPHLHWDVEIEADPDGELHTVCGCDFDDEPTCKHVVAALLAYAERLESEQVASAADRALSDRKHRGKTEVHVRHVTGSPTFGTWTAHTMTDPNAPTRPYTVQLRSVHERLNTCSCPDFAVNRLGTCKHIEGVLHQLKKRRARIPRLAHALVYLHWELNDGADIDGAPTIRVRLPDQPAPELTAILDRHFDARGVLRGALPDAWARLEKDAERRVDIDLGDDARAHASRVALTQTRAARATAIAEAIQRSGGHLPGVRARLYPYQTDGVAFLASNGRAMLADDMGLGKTLQAIAAARWLIDNESVTRVLVICPASLKTQWQREIQRFTGLDAVIIEGGAAPRHAQYRRGATFTIANYELVMRDLTALSDELRPDLLIVDEAQRLKNWRTKGAAAVKSLRTRYAFVLTGTPLENRLEDLYSIMQVVDGHVLGPLWHFIPRYHVLDARSTPVGFRNLAELRRRLRHVMLRRDKRLVRD
ncbi:MAG: SWIM zinc finger family protein, partial [Myxococcales bacterium]|nr:SWIM zinc finger family protein [Myxococcales bacterium]